MRRKLTSTLDEQVYQGWHIVVERRRISQFIGQQRNSYPFPFPCRHRPGEL